VSNITYKKTSRFMSRYDRHVFLHMMHCSSVDLQLHRKVSAKFLLPISLIDECRGTCSPNHRQYWNAEPWR
jgi:hypothetical protein